MSDSGLVPNLQKTLGDKYTVDRELGGGGMSRVFVATDTTLSRRVVVKVLSPELAQGISAERFAREIKVSAALQHPHIVPVLTAGESGGLPYYTMPYVEGESLRARLLRREPGAGPLPLHEAVGILRDVALALEYAHEHGVVHRDIKPENVLLAGRTAVVADFGIAKAVSEARTDSPGPARDGTLTSVGQSLGTPAYMAPEQVAGDKIDHRTDIYAWGMMAYELLAGRHPFASKASAAQLMGAQVTEIPAPLGDGRPHLPPPLTGLVMSCLAKNPDDRPARAELLLDALAATSTPTTASGRVTTMNPAKRRRMIGLAAVVGAVVIVGGVFAASMMSGGGANAEAPSLAVLPFEHQGDSTDAYYTAGITDEIRGRLSAIPQLVVIARTSSNQYDHTEKSPKQIADELGVRYLLTGTVRVVGTGADRRLLVRPELVEVTSSGQPQLRWQAPFEGDAKDVIRMQTSIAERVGEAMNVAVGGTTQAAIARASTTNSAAYDLYLRGEGAWGSGTGTDPRSTRRALDFFEQAVALDSGMVDAWVQIARARSGLYANSTPTAALAQASKDAADRTRTLDPDGVAGHLATCAYLRSVTGDLETAARECEEARRKAPGDNGVVRLLAATYTDLGRFDEALEMQERLLQRDPRFGAAWSSRARLLIRMQRPGEARRAADRALALLPTSLGAVSVRVQAELLGGDLAAARRAIAQAQSDIPRDEVLAFLGFYGDLGWALTPDDQKTLLSLDTEMFDDDAAGRATVFAQMHHWLGDSVKMRLWADSGARGLAAQLRDSPQDAQRHLLRGLMLGYLGRSGEAMDEVSRAIALADTDSRRMSAMTAYVYYVGARTALAIGRREKAVEWLGEAFGRNHNYGPAMVRLDPSWKPLRSDPAFEALLRREEAKHGIQPARD